MSNGVSKSVFCETPMDMLQRRLQPIKRTSVRLPLLCLLVFIFMNASALAAKNSKAGFIDFNLYPYMTDVDNDNTVTVNIFSKLEGRFSYFSLTNFGNEVDENELEETETFYTEQNIRWQIADDSPLDLTMQMNFRSGQANDRHRLGFRWRLNNTSALSDVFDSMNLKYSINFHLVQIDKEDADVWQMEHVFRLAMPYVSERLYLAGFIDHTFNQELASGYPTNPVVGEVQLGYRLVESLYVIGEYRVNQYRRSDVNNAAFGLEYKLTW